MSDQGLFANHVAVHAVTSSVVVTAPFAQLDSIVLMALVSLVLQVCQMV